MTTIHSYTATQKTVDGVSAKEILLGCIESERKQACCMNVGKFFSQTSQVQEA